MWDGLSELGNQHHQAMTRKPYVTTVNYKQRGLASGRDLQRLQEYLGDLYPWMNGRWVTMSMVWLRRPVILEGGYGLLAWLATWVAFYILNDSLHGICITSIQHVKSTTGTGAMEYHGSTHASKQNLHDILDHLAPRLCFLNPLKVLLDMLSYLRQRRRHWSSTSKLPSG